MSKIINELVTDLTVIEEAYSQKMSKLTSQIDELSNTNLNMKLDFQNCMAENTKLFQQIKEQQEEIKSLKEQIPKPVIQEPAIGYAQPVKNFRASRSGMVKRP